MILTQSQLQSIKSWIISNHNSVFDQSAADALNAPASPAYKVYRTFVSTAEVMGNSFDWTRVDNLNAGKSRIWDWMKEAYASNSVPGLNPANASCRAGINSVWVGTAADLAVRATVYSHCHRDATVAEKLLVTSGAGTAPDQNGDGPGVMGFEGIVTLQDVVDASNA